MLSIEVLLSATMCIGLTPLHPMSQTHGIDGQWEGNRRKGESARMMRLHSLMHIIPSHKPRDSLKRRGMRGFDFIGQFPVLDVKCGKCCCRVKRKTHLLAVSWSSFCLLELVHYNKSPTTALLHASPWPHEPPTFSLFEAAVLVGKTMKSGVSRVTFDGLLD